MAEKLDVIVLGLGAMGAASVYQPAKRGAKVLGIDQYAPPHTLGSSHGESRVTRIACAEGPHFTPLARRSHEIWKELEAETGKSLLTENGMLMIAPPGEHQEAHGTNNFLKATLDIARTWDVPHEKLDTAQLRARFPAFAIRDGDEGYLDRVSGFVRPEACIEAQLTLARKLGAALHLDEKAIEIDQDGDEAVVVTDKGTYRARQLIVAAGAYLPTLLNSEALNAHFRVTRQVFFWFKARDAASHRQFAPDRCPVFVWQLKGQTIFYGFPALGDLSEGLKIATEYDAPTSARGVDRTVSAPEIRHMYETFVKPSFPGLSDECVRTEVCLYTEVKGARFLIDRHPEHDRIIIASPCSGHGFKHSAAIGELLSRMALGECGTLPEFRFDYSPPAPMIVINMPGGGVEHVEGREILWFRTAFKSEWEGATMIRLSSGRSLYAREGVEQLEAKFRLAGVKIVRFTPPDFPMAMPVNATAVRQVKTANPAIYGPQARSVLEFLAGPRLAVKEEPAIARKMLGLDG